jgi:hypothetical protein
MAERNHRPDGTVAGKKSWTTPKLVRMTAGSAEAQRSSGNPDGRVTQGQGGQYS